MDIDPEPSFSFLSHLDLPGAKYDLWGYNNGENEYIIVASDDSETESGNIAIVDITDPSNPIIASTIDIYGADVKTWSHYLFVAQGSNTDTEKVSQIIDISDPLNPIVVGDFPAVHNIFIDDFGYLYVSGYYDNSFIANSSGLNVSIYDLNIDPINPILIWTAPSIEQNIIPVHDISVIRNKLYIFNISSSKVEIFDVTNQNSPTLLGLYQFTGGEKVHSGWVTEDDQYLFVCLEEREKESKDIIILDISNPSSPFEVGLIQDQEHTVHNLYIIGKYAYVSFYGAGLRVYDLTEPKQPKLIYEYDTNGSSQGLGAFGVYPFSDNGIISVSDYENGLFIFKRD